MTRVTVTKMTGARVWHLAHGRKKRIRNKYRKRRTVCRELNPRHGAPVMGTGDDGSFGVVAGVKRWGFWPARLSWYEIHTRYTWNQSWRHTLCNDLGQLRADVAKIRRPRAFHADGIFDDETSLRVARRLNAVARRELCWLTCHRDAPVCDAIRGGETCGGSTSSLVQRHGAPTPDDAWGDYVRFAVSLGEEAPDRSGYTHFEFRRRGGAWEPTGREAA